VETQPRVWLRLTSPEASKFPVVGTACVQSKTRGDLTKSVCEITITGRAVLAQSASQTVWRSVWTHWEGLQRSHRLPSWTKIVGPPGRGEEDGVQKVGEKGGTRKGKY